MVLEYAGSELFQYIVDHGAMKEAKARQFFQQIVCAVEYCHRHKIVHRDLKPENLLLDELLNVKIADFGLSNIMTDGNFLKTSCGSPNYAAPEVISGKLYAGPEVDVWSCGVILYVLLVGKLPFDDEYIPALFKKIASGQYRIPSDMSPGASRLIRKMLQVSPVHRITVHEIRQDAWFQQDLADYLKPPVEEFLDTGVDPNKAIDPRSLAPNATPAVQQKLHESVVGKLGKTMGYGFEDVQQALAIDEPNAIKDAYLIVRENQIMKETRECAHDPPPHARWTNPLPRVASVANDPKLQPFLASPPTHSTHSPMASMLAQERGDQPKPLTTRPAAERQRTGSQAVVDARSPLSTIGVLPSSLPDYHMAFMRGQPRPSTASSASSLPQTPGDSDKQTPEQQAATARRLKPHSRGSQVNLDKANRPEGLTPIASDGTGVSGPGPAKKPKPTKWQFGIRSRNQPAEAMLAIYKALRQMGAEWEVPRIRRPGGRGEGSERGSGAEDEGSGNTSEAYDSAEEDDRWREERRGRTPAPRHGSWNDWGYRVPSDPWVINARFRKDSMFPLGIAHPNSSNSSRVDLGMTPAVSSPATDADSGRSRRSSTLSSGGEQHDHASKKPHLPRSTSSNSMDANESAYVYMTIQLYSIEKEFYLVDFKCAGYEKLVARAVASQAKHLISPINPAEHIDHGGETLEERMAHERVRRERELDMRMTKDGQVGGGRAAEEKDTSSPFPFLDVASRLIIQLAEAE